MQIIKQAFGSWAIEFGKDPLSLAIDFTETSTLSDVALSFAQDWQMAWIYLILYCNWDFVSHLDNECRELLGAFSWGGRDFVEIDNDDAVVWGWEDSDDNSGYNGRRWWHRIDFNLFNSYS